MSTKTIALIFLSVVLYSLVGVLVYSALTQISGSADMDLFTEILWSATWPLIPIYLYN